jgi:hypothetical protein
MSAFAPKAPLARFEKAPDPPSAQVASSELFPFLLANTKTAPNKPPPSHMFQIQQQQQQQHQSPFAPSLFPLSQVKFASLITEDNKGHTIVYKQLCAQPQYEKFHPLQLRMQLEFPHLYALKQAHVQQLLEQKKQADRQKERQYRELLFGVSSW